MARFDPASYPDRLAFEANARRLRAQEFDRCVAATSAWIAAVGRHIVHAPTAASASVPQQQRAQH